MTNSKNFFRASAEDFKKIPGSPIAYWVSNRISSCFRKFKTIKEYSYSSVGLQTGDNDKFIHMWWEVVIENIKFDSWSSQDSYQIRRYFPYNKGGVYRKWYGNDECVVVWRNDGEEIIANAAKTGHHWQQYADNLKFKPMVTWSRISSGKAAFRYKPNGYMSDMAGFSIYPKNADDMFLILGFANSNSCREFLKFLSPTLNFMLGQVISLPLIYSENVRAVVTPLVKAIVGNSRADYTSYETSWDFERNPLVAAVRNPVSSDDNHAATEVLALSALYTVLRGKWASKCEEMRRLEMENNRIFIEAYGLQDELTPDVPWNEITLTCNPWYRYGKTAPNGDRNELPIDAELESRLKGDTVKELISYAVGCMMGRYSIDKPGLILADQGATLQDFLAKVPSPSYGVDEDGIIPILDNDWFADDIVTRFKEFVKVVFGEEHFFENMAWIEESLGKDIRSYFTKDFYKDHLQRYQNRPIYWLFQSPKGAFRALVYMHRYKPDMVGGVLGYLRSLQTKIDNQLDVAMLIGMDESKSASERVRANKDAVRFAKAKKELDEYERNVLYPLSTERIEIDLDDGVKVNYRKFGSALRKVAALEGKGE